VAVGIDNLTRGPGQVLPSITHVAPYVADSAHSNTVLNLSDAPNTHFSVRKKLTCQYLQPPSRRLAMPIVMTTQ
jgi:hypothetical protein